MESEIQTFREHHRCHDPQPSGKVNVFGGMECLSCGYEVVVAPWLSGPAKAVSPPAEPSLDVKGYRAFLRTKLAPRAPVGLDVPLSELHPGLMRFQAATVRWALRKGRAALFLSTGLGKTYCELAFGYHVGGQVLLFAPLAVGAQMVRMAEQWPFRGRVTQIKEPSEIDGDGIWITNYQRAERFAVIAERLNGLICDESSCLKDETAVTRKLLTEGFADVRSKLAASATPAPNDVTELCNHAEFLGVMKRQEVLATFFTHREDGWYIRRHAIQPFYRWLASWALVATKPGDLGFEHEDARFELPPLEIKESIVKTQWRAEGELFPSFGLRGVGDRASVRRASIPDRIERAVEIIQDSWGKKANH